MTVFVHCHTMAVCLDDENMIYGPYVFSTISNIDTSCICHWSVTLYNK